MAEESSMTEEERNQLYRQMADAFIAVANQYAEKENKLMVSSAFLYGAARFSAFVTAVGAQELEVYDEEREEATEYFVTELRRMLNENMDDYRRVFQPAPQETVTKVHKYTPQKQKPEEPKRFLNYDHLVKK